MSKKVTFSAEAVSETDIILRFNIPLSPSSAQMLNFVQAHITAQLSHHLIDSVLAYQSLLLCFSPTNTHSPAQRLAQTYDLVESALAASNRALVAPRTITLPVYYGSEAGADFEAVCAQTNLSAHELIIQHSAQPYHVYALGFSPGFAFLGELPPVLHLPRRSVPRLTLPAGSVAIAHNQTAVYPQPSPGGWHLIGRCPTQLFDARKKPPNLFTIGDKVIFEPISRAEYLALGGSL